MSRRFKSRKKKHRILYKLLWLSILSYVFFILFYNIIYNLYLSKLNNETIIEYIIENTKNNKGDIFFKKYTNPNKIISDNFVLKEVSDNTINVSKEENKDPVVYIYSTHDTESYSDKYLEVYNIKPTVKTVSYILNDYLSELGVNSIVESKSVNEVLKEHGWSYKYSYEASKEIITEPISKGNYKLIIDLHRDSSVLDKTLLEYNGRKYAKILFVVGAEHDNYEINHSLAVKLNNILEEEITGISRGISIKSGDGVNGIYNQDLSNKMVLIELGGQYNEIEELNNSTKILAKVIYRYLEEEI